MCVLFATITSNILEYIWVLLKFSLLLQISRQPINRPNLTYIIGSIYKTGFKDLDFFLPNKGAISKILKIMIFVDKINNAI